jgi:CBS domain-containing protein
MQKAKNIMTSDIITVSPDTTVTDLAKTLAAHNIGGTPVVDKTGKLLGIVTENDLIDQKKKIHIPTVVNILDSVIYLEKPERMEKEMLKFVGTTVEDIYSKDPISVDEETTIEEIATIMADNNVHTLPVMRGETLVGVIGKQDIIKTLIP